MNTVMTFVSRLDGAVNRHGARVGRIFIGILFLVSGISALFNFRDFADYAALFLPAATLVAALAVIAKIGGGLGLILGIRTRLASYMLFGFVLLTILFIHGPSLAKATDAMRAQSEMIAILKNIAILGGLLLVAKGAPASVSTPTDASPV